MKNDRSYPESLRLIFTILRLFIGWHFLYEGISKVFNPTWTSAWYLLDAQWWFGSIFRAIPESPVLLEIVDFLNIWGLIIVGITLLFGIFTRFGAIAGAALLFMYYISNPPFYGVKPGNFIEGNYLIINKNLIELVSLIVISILPSSIFYSLDIIRKSWKRKVISPVQAVPKEANHYQEEVRLDRRTLIKNLISVPVFGGFVYAVARNYGWGSHEEKHLEKAIGNSVNAVSSATARINTELSLSELKEKIPAGRIGDMDIGRVICGGNLISGFAHSRDLIYVSTFLKKYFNEQKVMDTFQLCEACGINTTALRVNSEEIKILNNYWKRGGKIQWIAPSHPEEKDFKTNIDLAIDNGAGAVMIMGNVGDEWIRSGRLDLVEETIDYIHSRGVPAGLTGHQLETIVKVEEAGIPTDFYMKTLHNRNYWSYQPDQQKTVPIIDNYAIDNYWAMTPEDTIAYMESINKPWIAFKTLAAGALDPREGLQYAFENGADFVCLGMFDFQVVEDANIVTDILNADLKRKRTWMA